MTDSRTSTQENDFKKGFASMDKEKQREIARKGGKVSHIHGTDYSYDSEETRVAGSKGGQLSPGSTKNVSNTSSRTTSNGDDKDHSSASHRGGSSGDHSRAGSQNHENN